MAYNRRETIKATADGKEAELHTVCHATFDTPTTFLKNTLLKTLRYFFNAIDRSDITHKGINKGKRVERMVYLESWRGRDNLHTHFFFKGTDDTEAELISQIATELMAKQNSTITQHQNLTQYK